MCEPARWKSSRCANTHTLPVKKKYGIAWHRLAMARHWPRGTRDLHSKAQCIPINRFVSHSLYINSPHSFFSQLKYQNSQHRKSMNPMRCGFPTLSRRFPSPRLPIPLFFLSGSYVPFSLQCLPSLGQKHKKGPSGAEHVATRGHRSNNMGANQLSQGANADIRGQSSLQKTFGPKSGITWHRQAPEPHLQATKKWHHLTNAVLFVSYWGRKSRPWIASEKWCNVIKLETAQTTKFLQPRLPTSENILALGIQ